MANTSLDKAQLIIAKLRMHVGFEGWWIGQHPDFQKKLIEEMAQTIEGAPSNAELAVTEDMRGVVEAAAEGSDAG